MIARGRDADAGGESAAIFYKTSELEPVESNFFWFSETPTVPGSKSWDANLTRIVTCVTFVHKATGAKVYYFNTHFDHIGVETRNKSAEILAARVAALPPDANVLITGDFNAIGGSSQPWETLTAAGLQDARVHALERKGPEASSCGFAAPIPDSNNRIDWIFTQGATRVDSCETIVNEKNGLFPSDHYPVMAKIVWPF
jgi:endonuclease/exonuclease/phosphatase family metal-dependent hydrolase